MYEKGESLKTLSSFIMAMSNVILIFQRLSAVDKLSQIC